MAQRGPSQDVFVCQGSNDVNCYEEYCRLLVKNKGIQAAFIDLKIRYKNTPFIVSQCHPLTHIIEQAATDKYPKVSEVYTSGDSFCWSRYYHGALEGMALKPGKEKLLAGLNDICADIPGKEKYLFDYFELRNAPFWVKIGK